VTGLLGVAAVGGTLGVGHGLLKARSAKKLMLSQMPKVVNKIAGWEEDMMAGLQRTMSGTGAQAEQNVKDIASHLKPRYSRARIGLGLGAAGVAAYGLHQALKKKDEPKTASADTDWLNDLLNKHYSEPDRILSMEEIAEIGARAKRIKFSRNIRKAGLGAAALGTAGLGGYGLYRALKKNEPKTAEADVRKSPLVIGGLGMIPGFGLPIAATAAGFGAPSGKERRALGGVLLGGTGGALAGAGLGALLGGRFGMGIGGTLGTGLGTGLGYLGAMHEPKTASDLADTILTQKK